MDRFIVFAAFVVFVLGCDSTGARRGGGFGNSATLTGDPVGKGGDPVDSLTRVIPIRVGGADITGTSAVLGRQSAISDPYTFIAPVTNQGGRRRCFVKTDTFDLLDGAGATIGTVTGDFVTGSVGKLKNGSMHTSTCLDVGETGYLLELLAWPAFASIASARITLTSSESEWEGPALAVVPVSYHAPVRDKAYTVTVVNQGSVVATVNSLSTALFFDDTDIPAYWGFLYSGSVTGNAPHDLDPGATYQLNSDVSTESWTGNSTKQLVFVDFRVKSSGENPTLITDAAAESRWRRQLAAKLDAGGRL